MVMTTPAGRDTPSTAAIAIATAILAGVAGYWIGQASSLGLFGASTRKSSNSRTGAKITSSDSEQDDGRGPKEQQLGSFPEHANEECKLVLVVRTDLGMSSGKIAAQCSHATLACYKTMVRKAPSSPVLQRWERLGQAKITLQVKTEEELEILQAQAVSLGLVGEIIHDAGRTEVASGSATVLGIGPGPKSVIDQVTGSLRLLR